MHVVKLQTKVPLKEEIPNDAVAGVLHTQTLLLKTYL